MDKKFLDHYSNSLKKGDTVKLIGIPLELFLGRTEAEQNILRAQIGNMHLIQDFNQHGKLKLEFYDKNDMPHTILISTSCVTRIFG